MEVWAASKPAPFRPSLADGQERTPVRSPDVAVAVVGAGIAGRMAAIAAASVAPTMLVTDGPLDRCNSIMAQGGVHAPLDEPDGVASMVSDMVASARVDIDRDRVTRFVEGAREVTGLLQRWGLEFDREADGSLRRRMAGGMTQRRVLTAGDEIGVPLLRLLGDQLRESDASLRTHTAVTDVGTGASGVTLELDGGDTITCRAAVFATGGGAYGHAQEVGERTTNPRNGNHTIMRRLADRGAAHVHPDYWQYQPFGLVDGPGGPPGRCVPETVAALGPRLLDRHGGVVCTLPADRLTVVDAMTAAADRAVTGDRGEGFLLTLSELDASTLRTAYPKLARTLDQMDRFGSDVVVRPFLHYQLGGIVIDADGATSLPGVFAAGEVTGGLHGRNRLMGTGITDALVHGRRAGFAAAAWAGG